MIGEDPFVYLNLNLVIIYFIQFKTQNKTQTGNVTCAALLQVHLGPTLARTSNLPIWIHITIFSSLNLVMIFRFDIVSLGISLLNMYSYLPFSSRCGFMAGQLKAIGWLSKCVWHNKHILGPCGPRKFSLNCAMRDLNAKISLASSGEMFSNFKYVCICRLAWNVLSILEPFMEFNLYNSYSWAFTLTNLLNEYSDLDLMYSKSNRIQKITQI